MGREKHTSETQAASRRSGRHHHRRHHPVVASPSVSAACISAFSLTRPTSTRTWPFSGSVGALAARNRPLEAEIPSVKPCREHWMFDDMAWTETPSDAGATPNWEMDLMRMRYTEGTQATGSMDRSAPSSAAAPLHGEPMELSPDPFYLNNGTTQSSNMGTFSNGHNPHPPIVHQTQQPTLTSSASCPSFASFYDIDGDDLLRDIPDGEPLGGEPLLGGVGFGTLMDMGGPSMGMSGGYDDVLKFQQQHQNASMRQFPHHSTAMNSNNHMTLLQQSRRQLHTSASFTSLSSMETEYRRHLATKRKKAVAERWNKVQRHKSFDSTTSSVATAPSPATSMEFSNYTSTNTFESTPETHYMEETPGPRRSSDAEMIGFSIDDFPTTFTSDASWPMPPPLSLASGAPFDGFTGASPQQLSQSSAYQSSDQASHPPGATEMDQLLLSDQERANVSSLLDAIRDFDSPLPAHPEDRPSVHEVKRASPTLRGKPRPGSAQHRSSRSPQLRGIVRTDSGKRKENAMTKHAVLPPNEETPAPTIRERIQRILEKSSSSVSLIDEERKYLAESSQFSAEKAAETAGSLWLLIHSSKCVDPSCSIAGCDVMRRVVRHCRGCDAPLGKCRDPCNDAKAMLLHHATCKQASISKDKTDEPTESTCALCSKMLEIDRTHNALNTRPPLSPQLKATPSPQLMAMTMPALAMPMPISSPLGGPVLIAPQPSFKSPTLKPTPASGPSFKPIQPNPLPTASNPMGMIGSFPHFGVSLALYLEQTSPPFRAEVKARVEKRVTAAAGQDLIQHMQKKTRLRSLDDLRAEARAIVLGEMERELHVHMQALNWATGVGKPGSEAATPGTSDSGMPAYLLSVAAAGFAAFYAQQATMQAAALAGVPSSFSLSAASTPRQALSRHSSTESLTSSASSPSLSTGPSLAPKTPSVDRQSPPLTRTESGKSKETALAV